MTLTNLTVLEKCIEDFKGDKRTLAAEIIATFRSLQAWAVRPYSQPVRKSRVAGVEKMDPESLPLPLTALRGG